MTTMIETFAPAIARATAAGGVTPFAPVTGWPRAVAAARRSLDAGLVISGIASGLAAALPLAWVAAVASF